MYRLPNENTLIDIEKDFKIKVSSNNRFRIKEIKSKSSQIDVEIFLGDFYMSINSAETGIEDFKIKYDEIVDRFYQYHFVLNQNKYAVQYITPRLPQDRLNKNEALVIMQNMIAQITDGRAIYEK